MPIIMLWTNIIPFTLYILCWHIKKTQTKYSYLQKTLNPVSFVALLCFEYKFDYMNLSLNLTSLSVPLHDAPTTMPHCSNSISR